MTMAIGTKGRSAAFLEHVYKDGGDDYFSLPVHVIAGLPPFWRTAALEVGAVVMILAREENNFDPTSQEIAARIESSRGQAKGSPPGHRSISFVQKGLAILDEPLVDEHGEVTRPGLGLIDRIRRGGRRFIAWTKGLKPNARGQKKDSPADPPGPPSEEFRDTSTTGGSSSSLESSPEKTAGPDPDEVRALFERAKRLVPVNFQRVSDVVVTYGSEWVSRALEDGEEHNRTCQRDGKRPVRSWGFVLDRLKRWSNEGGPPPKKAEPAPAKPARVAIVAAEEQPPHRLTAEELAELVAAGRSGPPALVKYNRVALRKALAEGSIDPEIAATIPAELLEPDPRAP